MSQISLVEASACIAALTAAYDEHRRAWEAGLPEGNDFVEGAVLVDTVDEVGSAFSPDLRRVLAADHEGGLLLANATDECRVSLASLVTALKNAAL